MKHNRWAPSAGLGRQLLVVALLLGVAGQTLGRGEPASAKPIADLSKADSAILQKARSDPASVLSLIIRESAPRSDAAESLVRALHGRVTRELSIVGGFAATLPASKLRDLLDSPTVLRVWGDGQVRVSGDTAKYDAAASNTVWQQTLLLPDARKTYDGSEVTVALLDTGVTPNLDLAGRIIASADLTSEADGIDRYGHGTHLAGIIAGNGLLSLGKWAGVAPKANLVSVKVAGADGSADVSVIIAGLQWVLAHRTTFNIKVLNLSFGTDSLQSYAVDPLDYAVEQVWVSGILVVVSAGNRGSGASTINKPADDPYVLTVGAADLKNTSSKDDDVVADFSSRGPTQDGISKPDVVAPGVTLVSNRALFSTVDLAHPSAAVDLNYMKGTGTSQAAAVVSGVAALMYQASPTMSPDVAKATIVGSTNGTLAKQSGGGAGLIIAKDSANNAKGGKFGGKPANVGLVPSTGLGSLEGSRGSAHVMVDLDGNGVQEELSGELGFGWTSGSWAGGDWTASSWTASSWGASSWGASSWTASSWTGGTWGASSWTASSWSASSWGASSWGASSWGASSWS